MAWDKRRNSAHNAKPSSLGSIMSSRMRSGFSSSARCEAAFAVRRRQHAIAFRRQQVRQRRAHGRFVFDDQNALHDYFFTGSSIVNRLPWPGSLCTVTRPPPRPPASSVNVSVSRRFAT